MHEAKIRFKHIWVNSLDKNQLGSLGSGILGEYSGPIIINKTTRATAVNPCLYGHGAQSYPL